MRVEVTDEVLTKEIPAKEDRPSKTIFSQVCFLHLNGRKYPIQFYAPIDSLGSAYPAGENYTFAPESFSVNQFGSLEFSRFDMALVDAKSTSLKAAS